MMFNDSQIIIPVIPRDFQIKGFDQLIGKEGNWLTVAPPGAGKTFLMLMLAKYHIEAGKRVLMSVHIISVLNQMIDIAHQWGFTFGVIQANHHLTYPSAPLQLASTSTLVKRDVRKVDVFICDEIHILSKAIYKMLLETKSQVLGFSATPFNAGLYAIFGENILNLVTAKELTELGILAPLRIISGAKINLMNLQKDSYGEFSASSIEAASKEILGDAIKTWKEFAENAQTLVFGSSISHAQMIASDFIKNGIPAAVYCSNTTSADRELYVRDFKSGKIKVLCSVAAIATGFDCPEAAVMMDMRPLRKSFSTLVQSVGRILRSAPNKPYATLIDCTGNIKRMSSDYIDLFLHGVSNLKTVAKKDKEAHDKDTTEEQPAGSPCPKCQTVGLWLKTTCLACGYVIPPKLANVRHIRENVEFKEIDIFSASPKKYHTNLELWEAICAHIYVKTDPRYYNQDRALKRAKALYHKFSGSWPAFKQRFIQNTRINNKVSAKIEQDILEYKVTSNINKITVKPNYDDINTLPWIN